MTIDEAIKQIEEIAEDNQKVVDTHHISDDISLDELYADDTEIIEEYLERYKECADDYRQLAEWLNELKQLREQQSCEDAISREQALKELNWLDLESDYYGEKVEEMLNSLPSVMPKGVTVTDFADKCRECGKQKNGKWIPVSESLPEDDRNVLFCDIDNDIMIGYHVKGGARTRFVQDGSFEDIKNVRAWRSLPERPF